MTALERPLLHSNAPVWNRLEPARQAGFQEVWYLKVNDPSTQRALWLRFTLLSSSNGFRRVSEVWALSFSRNPETREVTKVALKQTFELSSFSALQGKTESESGVRINTCELTSNRTCGSVTSKGRTIEWDLTLQPTREGSFNLVPEGLSRSGIIRNQILTVGEDLRFSGTTKVDGQTHSWEQAPGMQGHQCGRNSGHSWAWGHCNAFVQENGRPASFVFEGLTARARIAGAIPTPKLSSFYFNYQGHDHRFNSLWDAVHTRSQHTLNEWKFRAERGELSFRGTVVSEYRDFAGLTFEDTDGSLLYSANSKLSDMTVIVYRRGKLDATFKSRGTTAFEIVSRQRNPYVPLLV